MIFQITKSTQGGVPSFGETARISDISFIPNYGEGLYHLWLGIM